MSPHFALLELWAASLPQIRLYKSLWGQPRNVMASLEEATIQRRVFAWQGADTEP